MEHMEGNFDKVNVIKNWKCFAFYTINMQICLWYTENVERGENFDIYNDTSIIINYNYLAIILRL